MHRSLTLILGALLVASCSTGDPGDRRGSERATTLDTQRIAVIRVMSVDIPPLPPLLGSDGILSLDLPSAPAEQFVPFVAGTRETLLDAVMRASNARMHGRARMAVEPDQLAEATIHEPGFECSVSRRLLQSSPGYFEAWISYAEDRIGFAVKRIGFAEDRNGFAEDRNGFAEGDRYALKPTWIRFSEGQAFLLKVNGRDPSDPERSLVITIDRPGDESRIDC